jgi:hypothetical protein
MAKLLQVIFCSLILFLFTGCATERLPSEDLEVLEKHADLIAVLKNPDIRPNSKEKYEAIKKLIKFVDFSFTRETKTINDILYHGDAIVDVPKGESRNIIFNYQYENHYVRITFAVFRYFVLRVVIQEQ